MLAAANVLARANQTDVEPTIRQGEQLRRWQQQKNELKKYVKPRGGGTIRD